MRELYRSGSMLKRVLLVAAVVVLVWTLTGCTKAKDKVLIYTSAEDFRVEYLTSRLKDQFPNTDITIEYMSTGNHAAKLLAEGAKTDCDITYDLEYGYLEQLDALDMFADLSGYDMDIYQEDTVISKNYIIELRNGGAVILNTDVLAAKGLEEPASYADLLKPEYKGLVSMPNPTASGTGYMFLKSLVNAWGEEEAYAYFDKLTDNILQYTSSGSGPVNALVQGEVAVGLGMTSQAVTKINEGAENLKILYFQEGSPYSLYGQAIIKGKETKPAVKAVFDFLINTYNYENNEKFYPEKIYKDKDYVVKNFPQNIQYADMSNNSIEEKTRLLEKWHH